MIDKPRVTISDNAGGIDTKIVDKIFEPYFTTKEGNDGIGLYIAKMVVEKKLDGELSLMTDSQGSQFTMRFSLGQGLL
jgi:signal transduction histidine kinase